MNLSIHHVGGRWGTIPSIDKWVSFFPSFDITLYEPDQAAAEKIRRMDLKKERGFNSVNIQMDCLGEFDGASEFHLCFDRSASSMLPFDPEFSEYSVFIPQRGRGVYKLGIARQAETISVNVRSIGSLIAEGKISAPDVLSVDAEGAALQILKGVGQKNLQNVVGLFVESSFLPCRTGELPLHDMLSYLSREGFLLFEMSNMARYSLSEMHLGAYDRGIYTDIQDALFLRNPKTVDDPQTLQKLAMVSLLCGATSIAYECFKKLDKLGQEFAWHQPSENNGINFLHDFYKTFSSYRHLTLPKLDETFTVEIHNYMQYSDTYPPQDVFDRYSAHMASTIPKYLHVLAEYKQLEKIVPTHDMLYAKYGLNDLAETAKAERLRQIEFLKDALARVGVLKRG